MEELNKILGQVPQLVRDQGSQEEKLEEIWRMLGRHRNGMQARVAGDLAEKLQGHSRAPHLPVDDPRKAAKRLGAMLSGHTSLPMCVGFAFIECLPEPFQSAAKVMLFPRGKSTAAELVEILSLDQQHDEQTDHIRFSLATGKHASMTSEQLEAAAIAFDDDSSSSKQVAAALRAMAEEKRGAA